MLALPPAGLQQARRQSSSGQGRVLRANAWLRIGSDNSITFFCDRSEMGQGVYTSLADAIAEELGVALNRIKVEFAPAGAAYTNNLLGTQITGGSTSVRDAWEKLRNAGAQARTMLVAAAAKEWGVSPRAPAGSRRRHHPLAARQAGDLRRRGGSRLQTPGARERCALKRARRIKAHRHDREAPRHAAEGGWQRAVYGIDVRLPDMLYAALAQPPDLGGKVKSFDDSAAKTMPGYKATVQYLLRRRHRCGLVVARAQGARCAEDRVGRGPATRALNDAAILRGLQQGAAERQAKSRATMATSTPRSSPRRRR